MNIKHFLTAILFSALIGAISVSAQRSGRSLTNIRPNPIGISPITWIIFVFVTISVIYFFYWLFSHSKKKF